MRINSNVYPSLLIKSLTWPRESHGLFDYESRHTIKSTIKTTYDAKLVRSGNECRLYNNSATPEELQGVTVLAGITRKDDHFIISQESHASIDKMWLVIKYIKNRSNVRGYKLDEGDIFRLGRLRYRVRKINIQLKEDHDLSRLPSFMYSENAMLNLDPNELSKINQEKADIPVCRICLNDAVTDNNPLISPCKCAGTMKNIHLECLQHWLRSRVASKETPTSVYCYWKTLECELCKEKFPSSILVNGNPIDLISMSKPSMPYIILEDVRVDRNATRGLHVISLSEGGSINIVKSRQGRGHESEVRISDISVSRKHALIKLEKGNFYLEDLNSKFGTLAQIKKPVIIEEKGYTCVQISRSVIHFQLKQKWGFMTKCFRCKCFGDKTVPNNSDFAHNLPDDNRTIAIEDVQNRRLIIENIPEAINLGVPASDPESVRQPPQSPDLHNSIVPSFQAEIDYEEAVQIE